MLPSDIAAPSSVPYTDRKTGLVVFGIMTLLLGAVCALFVPLMVMGMSMAPKNSPSQDMRAILPAIAIYGILAVAFVWLGIGSIKARRWARALLLILSWGWLIVGLFSMVFMLVLMPRIIEVTSADVPAGQSGPPMGFIMGITMVFMFVIMVLIPGAWVLFYQSRHVKATCEAEDPVERWTDRCPLPVIGLSIWLGLTIPSLLFMALGYTAVVPFFGTFVVGPGGMAIYLLFAALWAYAAWAMYKLQWSGWWIAMVSVVLFAVSAFITYSRHDITELYNLMGYPAEQIAQMKKFSFMSGPTAAWMMLGFMLPFLGYLIFVRRYFVAPHAR
jgi:hypothetical protein